MNNFEGCPGSRAMSFDGPDGAPAEETDAITSQLRQWPIQLHLVSPMAPYFQSADVLLTADCVAFAVGNFHGQFLKGNSIAIACPKLDEGQDVYQQKVRSLIDDAQINTLTVLIMQVPCCSGLLATAQRAAAEAQRKVPVKCVVIGLQGEVLQEDWV